MQTEIRTVQASLYLHANPCRANQPAQSTTLRLLAWGWTTACCDHSWFHYHFEAYSAVNLR